MKTRQPIGYRLAGHDNKGHFFENCPVGTLCPVCQNCINWDYVPKRISIPRSSTYDISATYDNRLLWSRRAFDAMVGLELISADNAFKISTDHFDLFYFLPSEIVPFDAKASRTRITMSCECCGNPRDVTGSTPTFLACQELPGKGIFRTDLAFGSGKERFPLLIADLLSAQSIKDMRFRGLTLIECNAGPLEEH